MLSNRVQGPNVPDAVDKRVQEQRILASVHNAAHGLRDAFDDFAGGATDSARNRRLLGI